MILLFFLRVAAHIFGYFYFGTDVWVLVRVDPSFNPLVDLATPLNRAVGLYATSSFDLEIRPDP